MSDKFNELMYLVESLGSVKEDTAEPMSTTSEAASGHILPLNKPRRWDYEAEEVDLSGVDYTVRVDFSRLHSPEEFEIDKIEADYLDKDDNVQLETRPDVLEELTEIVSDIIYNDESFWDNKRRNWY